MWQEKAYRSGMAVVVAGEAIVAGAGARLHGKQAGGEVNSMTPFEFLHSKWPLIMLAIACAILLLFWCCGCATDAMCRGFEQIYHDNAAGETDDVAAVAETAMNKYGRSKKITNASTTQDTIRDIEADKLWGDYVTGGLAWLWNKAGWEEAALLVLMSALGIYQKTKNSRLKKDNEQMVEAGMGIPEFGDKVAKMQAKEMPLNKTVQKVKLKNGKEKV